MPPPEKPQPKRKLTAEQVLELFEKNMAKIVAYYQKLDHGQTYGVNTNAQIAAGNCLMALQKARNGEEWNPA